MLFNRSIVSSLSLKLVAVILCSLVVAIYGWVNSKTLKALGDRLGPAVAKYFSPDGCQVVPEERCYETSKRMILALSRASATLRQILSDPR